MVFSSLATKENSRAPPTRPPLSTPVTDEPAHAASNPIWSQLAVEHEALDAGLADAGVAAKGPTDAGAPLPPAPTGADACDSQEEEDRKRAFRFSIRSVSRFRPSAGYGMFEATYLPLASLMTTSVRMKFNFLPADDTPDLLSLWQLIMTGNTAEVARYFWTDAQQRQFERDYVARVAALWSLQYTFQSTKPCWPFSAHPLVYPAAVASDADAHFKVDVYKMSDPTGYRQSSFRARNPGTAGWQGSGELDENDVIDEPNKSSRAVARTERQRLERAVVSASASPVLFEQGESEVSAADSARLSALATAMKHKNPSDPAIPMRIDGYASAEGPGALNQQLSENRANAVRDVLQAAGVPHPLVPAGHGPIGAPHDAANRRAELRPDTAFESAYGGNVFSPAAHEFGHAIGLPDEYTNHLTGNLGQKQTDFIALANAAGVRPPDRWGQGDRTTSVMSVGVDVLPRHYLTLWEALGEMTHPDIERDEWSIR
jgi:outer membrane protein OmpA-like peptidoglycan-associated protein